MTTLSKRQMLGRVMRALDEEPISEVEAHEAVEELKLNVNVMAAHIRQMIAARDEVDRQARLKTKEELWRAEQDAFGSGPAEPIRERKEQIRRLRECLDQLPPDQVSMHFLKFEEATDRDLAQLLAIARHLAKRTP